MKPFSRNDRVGGQIQKILAELLRKQISDPRLANVTITGVEVSADLRIAKVYYSALAAGVSAEEILEGFLHATGFIKRELAQQLRLRYMPELKFFFDESIDYGARIEQLLKAAKQHDETDH
jgi:ribosome-binding factor A